jgi:hypothetical protein
VIVGKYAMVVSDSGYVLGINALVNGLRFYGNQLTFHHLYWGKKAQAWSKSVEDSGEFDFVSVNLKDLVDDPDYPKVETTRMSGAWFCKFYRYFYCALELTTAGYDAVCIMDADMMVVNNIMPWFEVAARTGKLIMPNNDMSAQEQFHYDPTRIGRGASPALHNMPFFFKPSAVISALFLSMPEIHTRLGISDMSSLNHAVIEAGQMENVLVLPNCLWLISVPWNIHLVRRMIGNKPCLLLHRTGDRVNSVHKPWWSPGYIKRLVERSPFEVTRDIVLNNATLFWDSLKFLNTELYHKVSWEVDFPEIKPWDK